MRMMMPSRLPIHKQTAQEETMKAHEHVWVTARIVDDAPTHAGKELQVCALCYYLKPESDDPIALVKEMDHAVELAKADFEVAVAEARARGVSWTVIGEALGISRQAAWERFSRRV